jgi:hypothetical protein
MKIRILLLTGIYSLLWQCDTNNGPVDLSDDMDIYKGYIESVRKDITGIRDLEFKIPVKTTFMTRDKLKDEFVTLHRHYASMTIMMKQLGFLPDTMKSIEPYILEHYSGFPAAYYITGTDSLVVIDPQDYSVGLLQSIIAHEFTHALQDQNFNLSRDVVFPNEPYSQFCTDYYLARTCVVEGDATVSELKFLISKGYLEPSLMSYLADSKNKYYEKFNTQDLPEYLNIMSMFPYDIGAYFVGQQWTKEGWSGVNKLYYANRPLSTVEIITGEKIEPCNFDYSQLIENWYDSCFSVQIAEDDNYGPVMLLALFKEYTDVSHAQNAFGWRGDRLLYLLSDSEKWGKFLWSFRFKDNESAEYSFRGFDAVLSERRIDGVAPQRFVITTDSMITYTTGPIKSRLIRNGTSVFWLENSSESDIAISGILNASLAKRGMKLYRKIEVDPVIIEIKRQIIDGYFFK